MLLRIAAGLPSFDGGPVFVSARPQLTAWRGKLLSKQPGRGTPVYAASFIREGKLILETSLFEDEALLSLIFAHELFHFAWPRLGNALRGSYDRLLASELAGGARGELGESSEIRKASISTGMAGWKDYVCESFCDTGAYLYAGVERHPWFNLAPRWLNRRRLWFQQSFQRSICER